MACELGHASVVTCGGARKLYAITKDGAAWLAASRPALDAIAERIAAARALHGETPPATSYARSRT